MIAIFSTKYNTVLYILDKEFHSWLVSVLKVAHSEKLDANDGNV